MKGYGRAPPDDRAAVFLAQEFLPAPVFDDELECLGHILNRLCAFLDILPVHCKVPVTLQEELLVACFAAHDDLVGKGFGRLIH